jgi:hypothetical protein
MSKQYEERIPKPQVPAARKYHVSTTCDLCNDVTINGWKESPYDDVNTDVEMKTGSIYPDGGEGKITTIDICPTCFAAKLIPWVEAQGGKPTVVEWDW